LFEGCSLRLTAPERFPDPVRLFQVVPYEQEAKLCGPYALAAVLDYLGINADPLEISRRIYSPGAGGVLTMDLYLEARRLGAHVRQDSGTLRGLYQEMDTGAPAIVLLRYPALGRSPGHFVVIAGYSDDPPGFFVLWGDGGLSWIDEKRLEALWSKSGFWALFFKKRG
jgi:ABC-type bacteriocin/lantibiotic exporter with double-glycine peptidase domain